MRGFSSQDSIRGSIVFTFAFLIMAETAVGQSAVLIESSSAEAKIQSEGSSFDDVFALRDKRRVGVGATFLGAAGLVGANLEFNFEAEHGLRMTLGGGPGYQSVGFSWKWLLNEATIHPIVGFGISSWSGTFQPGSPAPSPPDFLGSTVTPDEKSEGRFHHLFWTPAIGIEYLRTDGSGMGSGFFVQYVLLTEFRTLAQNGVAEIGLVHYF